MNSNAQTVFPHTDIGYGLIRFRYLVDYPPYRLLGEMRTKEPNCTGRFSPNKKGPWNDGYCPYGQSEMDMGPRANLYENVSAASLLPSHFPNHPTTE